MGFDHMPYGNGPSFTNPWGAPSNQLFGAGMSAHNTGYDTLAKQQSARSTGALPYTSIPAVAPPMSATYQGSPYPQADLIGMSQDLVNHSRPSYDHTSTPSVGSFAPTSAPYGNSYSTLAHTSQHEEPRRLSHGNSSSLQARPQPTFNDALDASRGMVALSQDMTPRGNLYGSGSDRGAADGYGFPAPHSSHSSISSASYTPSSYYSGSVDGSVSDYGSQSDLESVSSRTLPRPTGLIGGNGLPPPQSMMGQFNSKVSSSTQKKHKCKICDKRFTRPSSLQTHMYSHTGEKPYACEHEGCGRHFSVVSNLRRHRKVHKGDRSSASDSDHPSPEGSWTSEK
ncbi:uncharacterized protein KY384_008405 [Bacidia gigantensis]|uniref:uncharacterized protein n=1 Tax=Bacidia gigantensis TaxID=2732470 RepID=UPI001D050A6C|nr:uncharacterized protein KY384_008405 [Bacidia gigantensis]KAG8526976.1 hypothetical protein KY384_008405 [Bacidia gigantensis]